MITSEIRLFTSMNEGIGDATYDSDNGIFDVAIQNCETNG